MIYAIIFLLRVIDELFEGWEWYKDKQIGLGDRVREDIYKVIH